MPTLHKKTVIGFLVRNKSHTEPAKIILLVFAFLPGSRFCEQTLCSTTTEEKSRRKEYLFSLKFLLNVKQKRLYCWPGAVWQSKCRILRGRPKQVEHSYTKGSRFSVYSYGIVKEGDIGKLNLLIQGDVTMQWELSTIFDSLRWRLVKKDSKNWEKHWKIIANTTKFHLFVGVCGVLLYYKVLLILNHKFGEIFCYVNGSSSWSQSNPI